LSGGGLLLLVDPADSAGVAIPEFVQVVTPNSQGGFAQRTALRERSDDRPEWPLDGRVGRVGHLALPIELAVQPSTAGAILESHRWVPRRVTRVDDRTAYAVATKAAGTGRRLTTEVASGTSREYASRLWPDRTAPRTLWQRLPLWKVTINGE